VDEPSSGNLRLTACGILTHISLLMPTFALPHAPAVLTVDLHSKRNAPLPSIERRSDRRIRSFGTWLEPRWIFGAGSLDQ
jgi:hypothetical protein